MVDKDLVNPKNTAVLVIDIQNDYCSDKGKIAQIRKFDMRPIHAIIPRISEFLDYTRSKKIPIVWTRMIEHRKYVAPNMARKITIDLCEPGTWGFDYFEIGPKPGDWQIIKKHYDAFSNPQLQRILKTRKIKNLIIFGVYTAVCVDTTVRSAHRLGYNVVVPKDMVAMPKQRWNLHEAALENIGMIFAHLSTSEEIIGL